jgi:hypothetical protein
VSRTEVIAALDEYASLLAAHHAVVAQKLKPGLKRAEAMSLTGACRMTLPDEVAAIWEWHDGVKEEPYMYGSSAFEFVPYGRFCSLERSLDQSRQRVEQFVGWNPESDLVGRQFVTLIESQHPRIIECTPGAPPLTFLSDPASPLTDFPVLTIAERIGWWSWAIREGAWTIRADGQWHVDSSRYLPGRLNVF